jgi:hypothetical protein
MAVAMVQTRRCRNCGAKVGLHSVTCWSCRAPMRPGVEAAPARPLRAAVPTTRPVAPISQSSDDQVAFASGVLVGVTAVLVPFLVYLSMTAS